MTNRAIPHADIVDRARCHMGTHPELQAVLLARAENDQELRRKLVGLEASDGVVRERSQDHAQILRDLRHVDADNTAWMKDIVRDHRWPTLSMVDDDGADAAWLLVQHADHDRDFQQHCLGLMLQLPTHEVPRDHIAYLTDRVRLAFEQQQIYGTQVEIRDGVAAARDLEHPDSVDDRRAAMGLGPLSEYLTGFGQPGPTAPLNCQSSSP
jgi:hypothetical protein